MRKLYTVTSIATGEKYSTVLCDECAKTSVVSTNPAPVGGVPSPAPVGSTCGCGK